MVDIKILADRGITPEKLAPLFEADTAKRQGTKEQLDKVDSLHNRIRSRVQEGITRNLASWHWIYAMDLAWDTPFRQISPTFVEHLMSRQTKENEKDIYNLVQEWGLTHLIEEQRDPKTKENVKALNIPVFFQVFVPLVKAYVTIRWAKIVNDRRLTPFLKYEPAKVNTIDRTRCEVLTDRVQVMSTQYGYFDVMKQAVLKMLHYGFCYQFIKSAWEHEEQLRYATADDVKNGEKKAGTDTKAAVGDPIEVTVKEGLNYHLPHPSRIFRDLAHPACSFNTDTGCSYIGYWQIVRFREVLNAGFWNQDRVSIGNANIMEQNPLFFQTVYSACKMTIPVVGQSGAVQYGAGINQTDREKQVTVQFYGTDKGDQGVLLTNYFEKLIPSQNGLGDYDYPVWFRFVTAGGNNTVLYAEPLPSHPCIYYGYDADESREKNSSLSQEVMPFQDQFGMMLSQIILTCKQNLANLALVNTDVIKDQGVLEKIRNIGEKLYRTLNIFEYSEKAVIRLRNKPRATDDIIQTYSLPKGNVAEMINVLNTILNVLERVMMISSQEVAQAASHELRAEEVQNIAQSTSTRVVFTATPVDQARDSWKRQIYAYLMAFGEDDFYGHIPADNEITKEMLEKLGFSFVDDDDLVGKERFRRVRTSKKGFAIPLYELASTRDGEDRSSDASMAQAMATFTQALLANPLTAQAIGGDQAIMMANKIAKYAGIPLDLRNVGPKGTPQEQQQQAQEQLKGVIQQVLQKADQDIQQAITPLLEATKQNTTEIAAIIRALGMAPPAPGQEGPPPVVGAPPPQVMPPGPINAPPPAIPVAG